jgi:stage V sporulation protein R
VGLNSIPVVRVESVDKKTHTLHLHHEHDGRDLEIPYANRVLGYIVDLWGDEVKMFSILEDEIWEF